MKKLFALLVTCGLLSNHLSIAQNTFPASGSVGIGTATPDVSSILELQSTSQGFLITRMTQAQRGTIPSPANGLLIYQTDGVPGFYYYSSAGWLLLNNVRGLNSNIFIGQTAGEANTTGVRNIAIGKAALKRNTKRSNLVAIGDSALYNNGTGLSSSFEANYNTAVGAKALKNNSVGAWNSAFGYLALYANTIGNSNAAFGSEALQNNTYGEGNTAIGHHTLQFNNGFSNVAVGKNALNSNTSGSDNVAIGREALYSNTERSGCIAIGSGALYYNGLSVTQSYEATDNTAVGFEALNANTNGFDNTSVGYIALHNNTTGFHNTAIGSYSLASNNSGFYNVGLGDQTLVGNQNGAQNTALGHYSLVSVVSGTYNTGVGAYTNMDAALTNSTVIGNNAYLNTSNSVAVGNTSIVSIKGQVGFTTFSDLRIKENIAENVPGLKFINELRPVTYHYNIHEQNKMLGIKDNGSWEGKYDIEKIQFTGFIAQEVEAAAKKADYDFSGVDKTSNLLGLRYAEFTVPLVKAVQELDGKNTKLEEDNAALKAKVDALENTVAQMKSCIESLCNGIPSDKTGSLTAPSGVKLNISPNPASDKISIAYTLDNLYTNNTIRVIDEKGRELTSFRIADISGSQEISLTNYANGKYQVQMISNGKMSASQSFIISR